jgi:hypothetical protein
MAMSFVLTTETWLGPERTRYQARRLSWQSAYLNTQRMGVLRRIRRTPGLVFMTPEWLRADAIDEQYFRLLPSRQSTVTEEEAAVLADVFGKGASCRRCG